MPWYVIYTKPRAELKVAGQLKDMGIRTYCPTVTEEHLWSDRKKKVTLPLFRSYVFVNLNPKDRNQVFAAPGVVNYLFWLGKPAEVRDQEIQTIEAWNENQGVERMKVEQLSPGDRVTISKGIFKDQQALIKHVGDKRMRLILPGMGVVVNVKVRELAL